MAVENTRYLGIPKPVPGTERGAWGGILNEGSDTYDRYVYYAKIKPYTIDITDSSVLGYNKNVGTALNSSGLILPIGVGRIILDIKAGTDLEGTITLTGTAYDSYSNTEVSVTENIAINGVGTYISAYTYKNTIQIDYSDLTLSDYDVNYISIWNNRGRSFSVRSWNLQATHVSSIAKILVTLTLVDTTGGRYTVMDSKSLDLQPTHALEHEWAIGQTLGSQALNPQYKGIVVSAIISDIAHWKKLKLFMEIQEE